MIFFESHEVQHIYKIGDSHFDIKNKKKYHDTDVLHKIKSLSSDKLKEFLDYQFNDNPFQYSFVAMIYSKTNESWMPDNKKRNIVKNWLGGVLPVNVSIAGALFEGFLMNSMKELQAAPLIELIQYKESKEIEGILEFAKALSLESINLHRKYCTEMGCDSEIVHERKMDFISGRLKEIKSGINKISLDKMVWLGTQKEQAELWAVLKENGWIEDYKYDTIKACLTKSNTIQQVLKPSLDTSTGKNNYEGIYTTYYKSMFFGIKKNKKSSK